jgi:hypothetical protein
MKPETMYYIAHGHVFDLIGYADAWAGFIDLAEDEEQENRYRRQSLRAKARYVVGFDREMDRLVKEYSISPL